LNDGSIHLAINLMMYDLRAGIRIYRETLVEQQINVYSFIFA
jgi:hypothetical protein